MLPPAMPVPAPPVTAPRLGLLASAARPELTWDQWRNGITFRPNQSIGGSVADSQGYYWWVTGSNDDGGGQSPPPKSPGNTPLDLCTWYPYAVLEADQGTAIGWTADNYRQKVIDLLTANQSRKMELELWEGGITGPDSPSLIGNDHLTNEDTLDDLGQAGPTWALAELQQWLADTQNGRGMIHVQAKLFSFLLEASLVRREGNLVLDGFDNLVVVGSGYTGSGPNNSVPAAGATWAYATPIVQVVEGDIDVLPGDLSEALIRGTNQIEWRAERPVMAWWDNQKNHAGIEVVLCDPCGDLS